MQRFGCLFFVIVAVALFLPLTYRKVYHSRYHLDTLRQERFKTVWLLGFRLSQNQRLVRDRYGSIYTRITGVQPDPNHWRVMRPDYIEGSNGGFRCYNYGIEFHTRRQLLSTVFDRFEGGMPQETAAELIKKIDVAVPVQQGNLSINFEGADEIRTELGLETPWKRRAVEPTAPSDDDKLSK